MSQLQTDKSEALQPQSLLELRELTEVLVRHFRRTEGLWDVSIEIKIAIGTVGPNIETVLPGAMMGVSRVGIVQVEKAGPHTVDAANLFESV